MQMTHYDGQGQHVMPMPAWAGGGQDALQFIGRHDWDWGVSCAVTAGREKDNSVLSSLCTRCIPEESNCTTPALQTTQMMMWCILQH